MYCVDLGESFQMSMSLLLNLLFEQDSYSNEYLITKIGVDTAEKEPCKVPLDPIPGTWTGKGPGRRSPGPSGGRGRTPHAWRGAQSWAWSRQARQPAQTLTLNA